MSATRVVVLAFEGISLFHLSVAGLELGGEPDGGLGGRQGRPFRSLVA